MADKDVAARVVAKIGEMIESGCSLPWVRPWGMTNVSCVKIVDGYKEIKMPPRAWNRKGTFYKGVNTYLPVGEYITFNQCGLEKDKNGKPGKVKKGATHWPVLYWNFKVYEVTDEVTGETVKKTRPILRMYQVFRIEDTTLEQKHFPDQETYRIEISHTEVVDSIGDEDPTAEQLITDYVHRAKTLTVSKKIGNEAYYRPSTDSVVVPVREQFSDRDEYYSTLFHELGHSTGHESRLNRIKTSAGFGTEEYSKEELVAEITAATMLNLLAMDGGNTIRNSAAYIKAWMKRIQEDPMIYVNAANKAQKAVDMILGIEKEEDKHEQNE